MITHELDTLPESAERMDRYIARRRPDIEGVDWEAEGNAENIEIRDYFNARLRSFTQERWFLMWWNGFAMIHLLDLEPGERPRMFQTYCYVVNET